MPANDWQIGALYIPSYNGIGWTQPGGPNSPVFPRNVTGNFDLLSTKEFNTLTGQFIGNCGHSFNMVILFRDYDYVAGESVALLCCPNCSCVQRTISPFEAAVDGANILQNGILYP